MNVVQAIINKVIRLRKESIHLLRRLVMSNKVFIFRKRIPLFYKTLVTLIINKKKPYYLINYQIFI